MPNFSVAEREELRAKAWALSGQQMSNIDIAKELGIHRQTVSKLLKAERERRRELMPDEDLKAISTYESVMKESWETFKQLKAHDQLRAQNIVGFMNAIVGAQNGKNRVTGVEKPNKHTFTDEHGEPMEFTFSIQKANQANTDSIEES